jgi:hypothetical protein
MKMSTLYAYCDRCAAYITIELPPDVISEHTVYPFPYTYVHGDPPHALTIYLDQDLIERGHEVSELHPDTRVGLGKAPPSASPAASATAVPAPSASAMGGGKRIVPHVTTDLTKQKLSITEFRLLNLCDGHTTIQEIAEKLGLQFFVAMRMLLDLQKRGLVDFENRV